MAQRKRETRDGKLQCAGPCGRWLHPNRFYRRRRQGPNGSIWIYDRECKLCQQTKRVEVKHADPATAILLGRAGHVARTHGLGRTFVLEDLNYWSLLPQLRGMLGPEGLCPNCGHEYDHERDVQLDHREPPRHRGDLARLHARNVAILCGSCNNTKGTMAYADWLDDQESARLSANALSADQPLDPPDEQQLTIDDFLC